MRVSIIDLGTNSVRFDVYEFRGQEVAQLHREKLLVRLGQDVFKTGHLNSHAKKRTIKAFQSFQTTCKLLHVKRIVAFGTSALRETHDAQSLISAIHKKTGIRIQVISGEEEARLICRGILSQEKKLPSKFSLIDIGGGSTEITVFDGGKILHSFSFPLGSARLQQTFLKTNPPRSKQDVDDLRKHIRGVLRSRMKKENWKSTDRIIGSSGTIKAFGKIIKETSGRDSFTTKELTKLLRKITFMTPKELLKVPGMEAKRIDLILAGGILLQECLRALKSKNVSMTEYSMRHGVLEEEKVLHETRTQSSVGLHLKELEVKIKALFPSASRGFQHAQQTRVLCVDLFDQMKTIHKLKPSWRPLMEAACLLHDIGEIICPSRHAEHSYYFVDNMDFPSFSPEERLFVAFLCRFHQNQKLSKADLQELPAAWKTPFVKILSLLQVADALDRSRQSLVKRIKVRRTGRKLISFDCRKRAKGVHQIPLELEELRLEMKKELFEKTYGVKLNLVY